MMHNSTFEFTGYAISFNLNAEGTKVKKKITSNRINFYR